MIVTGLDHFTIRAPADVIDDCVSFYTSILNLRLGFRPPLETRGFWLYAAEEPLLHLEIDDGSGTAAVGYLDHIAFTCVNLPVTIRRFTDLGLDYATNHIPEIDQFQVLVRDPAGIGVELNFTCETLDPNPTAPPSGDGPSA